jgi:hypothetical protein
VQIIIEKEAAEVLKKKLSDKKKPHSLKIIASVVC